MRKYLLIPLFSALLLPSQAQEVSSQVQDSVPSTRVTRNRNVMLNASSDNQPRQISIGLPEKQSSDIFEDGLPVSFCYWPVGAYNTWRTGVSHSQEPLMSLSESALRFGMVDYIIDSKNRMATESFKGLTNYTLNHHGKHVIDANLSGPIAGGWGYSLSTYQTFDPSSNHLDALPLQERMQNYKLGLSRTLGEDRGEVSLVYQYANNMTFYDKAGLFYYNGADGSVDQFEDFDLGKSQYLPDYTSLHYQRVLTGEYVDESLDDALRVKTHQVGLNLDYRLSDLVNFNAHSRFKYGDQGHISFPVQGIFNVDATEGYTYENGTPYSGNVQGRYLLHHKGFERSWMTSAELDGKSASQRHSWRLGLNEWINHASIQANTVIYAQEAKEDPRILYLNGDIGSNYNTGSEYYNGWENKLALYASDDWNISSRLWVSAGARLEWQSTGVKGLFAYHSDGTLFEPRNIRAEHFSLQGGGVKNYYHGSWLNPSFTLNARYTLLHGFGLTGEYVYVTQHPNMQDYAGPYLPFSGSILTALARGGIYWNNSWIQLTSQIFHIQQSNYKSRDRFINPDDPSEVIIMPILYDVATIGWTTDMVLTPFKGFKFHGLVTFQDPKYKNFDFQPEYSTGKGPEYSFTDKSVTAMSKFLLELDPSYQWGDWRVWLSFRYQSKQFINRTNTLYFKGRWETFGGVDYTLNKNVAFSLNLVNILNQKGASGKIGAADLATDVSAYQHHYLMSGNYIRPFTVELSTKLNF